MICNGPSQIINPLARERQFGFGSGMGGGGGGFTGPLDAFTTPFAAWSLYRRLLSSWTGALIKLRRSSGGESDFGFDVGTNLLDTAAITTWAGGATLYLVTEYDQTGNGRHRTQGTAGTQPTFTLTGGPASGIPRMDGADLAKYVETAGGIAYTGKDFTWSVVANSVNLFRGNLFTVDAAAVRLDRLSVGVTTSVNIVSINGTPISVAGTSTGWRVQTAKRTTNSLRLCADGTPGTGTESTPLSVDKYRSGSYYTCEAIVWHSALSDADQDALHTNQRTAFSL
jgi:hypothetical protein